VSNGGLGGSGPSRELLGEAGANVLANEEEEEEQEQRSSRMGQILISCKVMYLTMMS
jgi:hypothetical protein